ncbi:GNAT family N-acetyltransferase [Pseudooceanicola aestuarii]|uniref:GNAT family N-acetyltransferase n=1 Tax=Pseudooceanicola aestuarii TaxID=2697319 RepID=UPI0013D85D07|nr:GNAT family N-acetyltransferase [Pseudooceanicola aestuarii]
MTALAPPALELPIPVIKTERLILRAPRAGDYDAVGDFMRDPDRTRHLGGPATEEFDIWRAYLSVVGHWMWRGYGLWTVADKTTDKALGRVGMIHHVMWPEAELGWHVFTGAEGRGIAHEAALAARLHAAEHFGLPRLISQIHPDNTRSRALAERMGAVVERETTLLGDPCLIYRHPDPRDTADGPADTRPDARRGETE